MMVTRSYQGTSATIKRKKRKKEIKRSFTTKTVSFALHNTVTSSTPMDIRTMKITSLTLISILLNLEVTHQQFSPKINSSGSIITAPNAGLVMLHKGQYIPANHIISNTVMFPMTANTCYLLPINAARKISACNYFKIPARHKRLVAEIITIGASFISMGTAATSIALTMKLDSKVNQLQTNMRRLSDRLEIGEARMIKFETNQIRLGMILQQSEHLLNSSIDQINKHTRTLDIHEKRLGDHERKLLTLQRRLEEHDRDTTNRFLHPSIHSIINNQPTLEFLHPQDLHTMIIAIINETNIAISNTIERLPIVELITKLIIRQQIDFIPVQLCSTTTSIEIGKLTFTTFFALPNEQESQFHVYKIIIGPFLHNENIVQLAQMPAYVGINQKSNVTMTWTTEDSSSCIFDVITTCRHTPAEKKLESEDRCLQQILTGTNLTNCRIEPSTTNLPHIEQIQNGQWLISTNNSYLHCIRATIQLKTSNKPAVWSENLQVIIPPVAVVSVPNGTIVHCPGFNLPGSTITDIKPIINIIKNLSITEENKEVIDMHKELVSNATWEKLPYVNGEVDALIQHMLSQTIHTEKTNVKKTYLNRTSSNIIILLLVAIVLLVIIIGLRVWCEKRSSNTKAIILPQLSV